jgi:DegV family protein with EDD domain
MPDQIALVTDSTSDIPLQWREQYKIGVVPLTIIFGNQQYLDGVELTPEAFYERLVEDRAHPSTSQPTPLAFLEAFREAAANGAKQVLTILISEALSGTILSARQAALESPIPVTILNSKSTSLGLGWQVVAAARAREAGADLEGMVSAAKNALKKMAFYVSLNTIEFLSKGGRIGGAVKFLDSVISIKPMVYVNHETGAIAASMPSRSRKDAIDNLYKQFFKHIARDFPMHIAVLHNAAYQEAQNLAERIRREYSAAEIIIGIASPVLGVHSGPGALAIAGYSES